MDKFQELAKIVNITKQGKKFYMKANFRNTWHQCEITLKEAAELEVGQSIKIQWWWNRNGSGIGSELIRPIEILQETKQKFRTLK